MLLLIFLVFFGEDNLVKFGDFGFFKVMVFYDFVFIYVGIFFYMFFEICVVEKYILKFDIWLLGCIIYEFCIRELLFNVKMYF